jgi:hypothetical protein
MSHEVRVRHEDGTIKTITSIDVWSDGDIRCILPQWGAATRRWAYESVTGRRGKTDDQIAAEILSWPMPRKREMFDWVLAKNAEQVRMAYAIPAGEPIPEQFRNGKPGDVEGMYGPSVVS